MRYRRGYAGATSLWALIAICLIVFLAEYVVPGLDINLALIPAVVGERPWTIITSMFVHAGFQHILFNMLSLYFLGTALIDLVGDRKFLLVYFLGGILGGVFFILLGPRFAAVVGASGAIFAVGGALVALRPTMRVFVFPIPAPIPLWASILGSFVILSFMPGVAWQAHLGGLVLGLLAGYIFRRRERQRLFSWRR